MKSLALFTIICILSLNLFAQAHQFRGPERTGHYPDKNLLDVWPAEGPEVVLSIEGFGNGYAMPSITKAGIYIAGEKDSIGTLYAYNHNGKEIWKYTYGKEFMYKFPGARSTATIDGKYLYYFGSMGDAFCLKVKTGKKVWHVNLADTYGAELLKWGNAESPLLMDDKVIFTPGGKEHNIIALDKKTGELIWTSKAMGDYSTYCSPILIEQGRKRVIVTQTQYHIIGIDSEDGKLLWQTENNSPRGTNPNTPIIVNNLLFNSIGYGYGSAMYQLNDDFSNPDTVWTTEDMDNKMDGPLLIDGAIYGCGDRKKYWFCLDWETGKTLWKEKGPFTSATIFADGKIFAHGYNGDVSLIKPNKEKLEVISSFSTTTGEKTLFAHPSLFEGKLYIRDKDKLTVYNVTK